MENNKFNIGDIVTLKSGGPQMTIQGFFKSTEGEEQKISECIWFNGTDFNVNSFHVDSIKIVTQ